MTLQFPPEEEEEEEQLYMDTGWTTIGHTQGKQTRGVSNSGIISYKEETLKVPYYAKLTNSVFSASLSCE